MYDDDLPEFRPVDEQYAHDYITTVLHTDNLCALYPQPDGHFRAVFRQNYFHIAEGRDSPSKSQWSTLKKRMKRVNKGVFVFKETGPAACPAECEGPCYYIDFGFFLHPA